VSTPARKRPRAFARSCPIGSGSSIEPKHLEKEQTMTKLGLPAFDNIPPAGPSVGRKDLSATHDIYHFDAVTIEGERIPLSQFRGQPLLVVNTASACGFTPQFAGLEALHRRYGTAQGGAGSAGGGGLTVLGFPCNQFARQDRGSNAEIHTFCQRNYGVSFRMMARIDVRGPDASPIFQWLTDRAPGVLGTRAVKWNFTKFLVARDGRTVQRFAPRTKPEALVEPIERALAG
jgi:glutathione peroxidase